MVLSLVIMVKAVKKHLLKNFAKVRDFPSKKLIQTFISCRVDYYSALLTGVPTKFIRPLQLIQNATARVQNKTKKRDRHMTPILRSLHWLPDLLKTDFTLLLIVTLWYGS